MYNLAAQSHVAVSFEAPEYTADVVALGTLRLLESIRSLDMVENVKFYQTLLQSYLGWFKNLLRVSLLPFILGALMQLQNYLHIGQL